MRRLFSWGKYGQMLALKELLLRAAAENNGLSDEDRGNLRGECDLILSFLAYNDIAGMSALHRSACRQMTPAAVSHPHLRFLHLRLPLRAADVPPRSGRAG